MIGKIIGYSTVVMGVLVLFGAALGLVREDATNDCNVAWKSKIELQTANLRAQIAEQAKVIALKDQQLEVAVKTADEAMAKAKVELETQRASNPLSVDCTRCRVPNQYIWLRKSASSKPATH